jgi:hypothetical protein
VGSVPLGKNLRSDCRVCNFGPEPHCALSGSPIDHKGALPMGEKLVAQRPKFWEIG